MNTELKKVVKEVAPALKRVKLLRGTTAAAVAEQLLGEVDHGFIPVFIDYVFLISEHSGKRPEAGCSWAWNDSGLKIHPDYREVEAFTSGKHWVCLNRNGDITEADHHFYNPECCRFWSDQAEFISA